MQVPAFKIIDAVDPFLSRPDRLEDAARLLSSVSSTNESALVEGFTALADGLAPYADDLDLDLPTMAQQLLLDDAFKAGLSFSSNGHNVQARVPGSLDAIRMMGVDDPLAAVRRLADEAGMVSVQTRAIDRADTVAAQLQKAEHALGATDLQPNGTWGYVKSVQVSSVNYVGDPVYANRLFATPHPSELQATVTSGRAELRELQGVIDDIDFAARDASEFGRSIA